MPQNTKEWDLILLKETESINTQTIWHAAALARSRGIQDHDILIIDWPRDPFVSCGFHQAIDMVVDLEKCELLNIPVIRRACGGGAVLLNKNQIFYHIVSHIDSGIVPRPVHQMYSLLLEPVVDTYRTFGVDAHYQPINDIICKGRKLSGNGAALLEKAQVLVGNFILDFPKKQLVEILRVPDEKFRNKVYKTLEDGISSFLDELGEIPSRKEIIETYISKIESKLGISLVSTKLSPETLKIMDDLHQEYLTDEWRFQVTQRGANLLNKIKIHSSAHVVQGTYKSTGGLIQVICEFRDTILNDILISGDFWIYPDTVLPLLEQFLKGIDLQQGTLTDKIENFLQNNHCETPGTNAKDLSQAIINAYQQLTLK
ncbi:lipoate--protein ligase family protein [Candidatus Hodarchaeum mangrovi]